MLRAIAGLLTLLAFTQPARADFIVTPFLVSLLVTVGVPAAIASTVASVIVLGALVGVSLLLSKRPKLPEPPDGKILVKSAVPPKQWGVGESRQIGALIASEMSGATSYDVSAMHAGQIASFSYFYVGEDLVEFANDSTGPAIPNPGPGYVRLPGPYTGRYMGDEESDKNTYIDWRIGLPTETPYQEMIDALPGTWTENHRGDGVATVMCIAQTPDDKSFSRRFPNGLPRVSAVGKWTIAWDPRDPTQDREDRETWKFSENPFVLLLDFYLHHEAGFHRPFELVYEPTAEYWIAAMDVCDELVPLKIGGTEKRYIASGRYDAETPRKSIVEAYLRACDGYLEEIGGGSVIVYAGKFYPSNFTLTDEDIIDDSVVFNRNDNEQINTINIKVVSKEHDYNEVEADQWINQAAIDAGAPRKAADVQAEFSSSWRQSRRLGKIELSKQSAVAKGSALVNLNGENLKGRRFFRLDMPDRGTKLTSVWAEKTKLEDRVASEGGWYLEYELMDPTRYDWDEDTEEGEPPQVPDETEDGEYPVPNLPTLSVIRKTAGGQTVVVISATNPPVTGWPNLKLGGEYQQPGDDTWLQMTPVDGELQCLSGPVVDGDYKVHTWFIGAGGGKGDQSPDATITVVTDATAPMTPITPKADLQPNTTSPTSVLASAKSGKNDKRVGALECWRHTFAQSDPKTGTLIDGDPQDVTANQVAYWTDTSTTPGARRYSFYALNKSGVRSLAFATAEVAFPGDVFSDNFTRSNQTLETSANWSRAGGSAGAAIIISNVLNAAVGTGRTAYLAPDLYWKNLFCEATLAYTTNRNDYPVAFPIDSDNFIGARYASGAWSIWKSVGGTQTQIATTTTGAPSVGSVARLEKTVSAGTATITLKVGGVTIGTPPTLTDASLVGITRPGLIMREASGAVMSAWKAGVIA